MNLLSAFLYILLSYWWLWLIILVVSALISWYIYGSVMVARSLELGFKGLIDQVETDRKYAKFFAWLEANVTREMNVYTIYRKQEKGKGKHESFTNSVTGEYGTGPGDELYPGRDRSN